MAPKRSHRTNDEDSVRRLYAELDRLEELLEDMAELNISTAAEAESRIVALNAQIDDLENDDGNQ